MAKRIAALKPSKLVTATVATTYSRADRIAGNESDIEKAVAGRNPANGIWMFEIWKMSTHDNA